MSKKKDKKTTDLVKPLTKEEVKNRIKSVGTYENHPEKIYKEIGNILGKEKGKYTDEDLNYLRDNLLKIAGFDYNHMLLGNTTSKDALTTVIELANDIIKEYNCTTTLEKSLGEVIANSYGKIMDVSRKLNNQLGAEYLTNDRINYVGILSKELDRENRNYLNALNNLIEIKRPSMSISIKTNNAYIGQNQQFNNNNIEENENIKD